MNRLSQLRRDTPQSVLVAKMNIPHLDRSLYSKLETGVALPSLEMAQALAAYFRVTVSYIWPGVSFAAPAPENVSTDGAQALNAEYYINVVKRIPVGGVLSVTRRELMALTGLSDREVRRRISAARKDKYPIVSFGRGYYVTDSREEVQAFCNILYARSNDERETADAMLRHFDKPQIPGQICIKCGDESESGLCDNCKSSFKKESAATSCTGATQGKCTA